MTRKTRRYAAPALVGALALLAYCAGPAAAQDTAVQKARLSIVGDMKMKFQGKTVAIALDNKVSYILSRKGDEVTATINGMEMTAKQDSREVMHLVIDKDRILLKQMEKVLKDVTRDKAEGEDKQKLEDLFGKPIMTYTTDKSGKELKRTLTTAAGAKAEVDGGIASNIRLFHAPFPTDKEKWQAPAEFGMGNRALVKGNLTYEKVKPAEGAKQVKVKVSGTLTNKEAQQGPATAKNVVYKVKGEQTYDLKRKQWVAGKLVMDVSFSLEADGMELGTASGEMTCTLTDLSAK